MCRQQGAMESWNDLALVSGRQGLDTGRSVVGGGRDGAGLEALLAAAHRRTRHEQEAAGGSSGHLLLRLNGQRTYGQTDGGATHPSATGMVLLLAAKARIEH